jgi:hypothetical protein
LHIEEQKPKEESMNVINRQWGMCVNGGSLLAAAFSLTLVGCGAAATDAQEGSAGKLGNAGEQGDEIDEASSAIMNGNGDPTMLPSGAWLYTSRRASYANADRLISIHPQNGERRFELVLNPDCELRLYDKGTGGSTVLHSSRSDTTYCDFVMQSDGNLVLYPGVPGGHLPASWATNTAGRSGAQAKMQHDGNLVVTAPNGRVWWSLWYGRTY